MRISEHCTRGSLEMAFVPGGYYDEVEEEGGFDFGDDFQYEHNPLEVCGGTAIKPEQALSSSLEQVIVREAGRKEDEVDEERFSGSLPKEGGDGSPSGEDCSSDMSSQSPNTSCLARKNRSNSRCSPVKFKISSQESEDSVEYSDEATEPSVFEPLGVLKPSIGRVVPCDRDGGMAREESKGQLRALEVGEDMKVALGKGNMEQVKRILDEGRQGSS